MVSLKQRWLSNPVRKKRLKNKVERAFFTAKRELVYALNHSVGEPNALMKYLAQCVDTDDVMTFIQYMDGAIKTAEECDNDPEAIRAIQVCKRIKFRIDWLSNFTLWWTTLTVRCPKCHYSYKTNFLYTDKICPVCGTIVIKEK